MYHSVTFSLPDPSNPSTNKWSKNSYSDFHLVSDGRPVIALPEHITNYVEVPGASGRLDMSESLTNYPLYGDREGSIEFIVLTDYGPGDSWSKRYQMISRYIHGRHLELALEDDPDYFYEGRFAIDGWESPSDGGNSTISIQYTLDTYKYWQTRTEQSVNVSGSTQSIQFSHNRGNLGIMPVVPIFYVTSVSSDITITATNPEIYSGTITHVVNYPATYQFQDIVLTDFDYINTCTLTFSGNGSVRIALRNGEL